MIKKVEIEVEIKHREIKDNICVYQVKYMFKDNILTNITRLCYTSELEELYKNPSTFSNSKQRDLDNYKPCRSHIKDVIKMDWNSMDLSDYLINKDYVLNHDEDYSDLIFIRVDFYNDNLYEINSKIPLPRSVHFDYINGVIDNAHYNLEEVLKFLENRKDITINRDKYTFAIHDIPYYNAHYNTYYNRDKYIDFTWHPIDEDWNKYVNSEYFEKWNRYDYIANEIIGLKQCLKENNDD